MLEGSKVCWFLIVSFRLVLSNLIVFSVCSHSFPYGEHLCRVLAWLNCPPYVFGLTCRILLKSSDTNCHSGHCPVIPLNPVILQSRPSTCLWKAIHAVAYCQVYVTVMDQGKEVVLDDDLWWDHAEGQPHMFVVLHFGVQIETFYVRHHELHLGCGDYAL